MTNLSQSAPGTRAWRYSWPDGAAIIVQRGAVAELWLNADMVTGRYVWSSWGGDEPGADFRRWALRSAESDPYYLTKKLVQGRPREFLREETDKEVRRYILQQRLCGEFTKERARELYDDWCEFGTDGRDAGEVYRWGSDHDIYNPEDLLVTRTHGIEDMQEHVGRLAKALRAELDAEAAAAAPPVVG